MEDAFETTQGVVGVAFLAFCKAEWTTISIASFAGYIAKSVLKHFGATASGYKADSSTVSPLPAKISAILGSVNINLRGERL